MPFYTWRGITIEAKECRGKLFAFSPTQLDERLFAQGIALLSYSEKKPLFPPRLTTDTKVLFFQELSVLLNAAILLPDALMMLGSQFPQYALQEIIQTLAHRVSEGIALHEAMKEFSDFFGVFMVQMVCIGYESGNLSGSIALLNEHLQTEQRFKKKMRAALVAPVCTFIFFLITTFVIFVFIVPHFASLLQTAEKPLPTTTRYMLQFSAFLSSLTFPLVILTSLVVLLVAWRRMRTKTQTSWISNVILRIPFFGNLLRDRVLAHCFNSLHILLSGGVQLVDGMHIVAHSMCTTLIAHHLTLLTQQLSSGMSLSRALYLSDSAIFDSAIVSMITIAQESGELTGAMGHVSRVCTHRVTRKLNLLSTTLQPLLFIILGVLVSLLVFSIYVPLFSMAETIAF